MCWSPTRARRRASAAGLPGRAPPSSPAAPPAPPPICPAGARSRCWRRGSTAGSISQRRCAGPAPPPRSPAWRSARKARCRNARRSTGRCSGCEQRGELGEDGAVDVALERHDQLGEARRRQPLPGVELGVFGGEVYVLVAAGEAQRKPFLPLPAVAPAPQPAVGPAGQVVGV